MPVVHPTVRASDTKLNSHQREQSSSRLNLDIDTDTLPLQAPGIGALRMTRDPDSDHLRSIGSPKMPHSGGRSTTDFGQLEFSRANVPVTPGSGGGGNVDLVMRSAGKEGGGGRGSWREPEPEQIGRTSSDLQEDWC